MIIYKSNIKKDYVYNTETKEFKAIPKTYNYQITYDIKNIITIKVFNRLKKAIRNKKRIHIEKYDFIILRVSDGVICRDKRNGLPAHIGIKNKLFEKDYKYFLDNAMQ